MRIDIVTALAKAYFVIAFIYMFYSVSTTTCSAFETKYQTCLPKAIGTSMIKSMVWPLAITFEMSH